MNTNKIHSIKNSACAMFCCVLIFIFSSCSNDTPTSNNNQNTGGHQNTPIGTPDGTPVTASIGASGGSLISSDSSIELIIPAGALNSNTDITIQPITNFCFNGHSDAFRLMPDGQQFAQPVTVRFHYSAEVLQNTFNILMGIARQDASGYWHYFNDINNDTVNRVISTTITHFGLTGDVSSGGGDFSFFDIAHIEPRNTQVSVNQSVNMAVTYMAVPGEGGDDELYNLPHPIDSWYVNGVRNGNTTLGTIINSHEQSAVFRAPASIPYPDVVSVQALVNTNINYRGQVIGVSLLQSTVKIISDSLTFDLKIDMYMHDYEFGLIEYHCDYTDGADMVITVTGSFPRNVTITNITNRHPNVTPPSGHFPNGQGSITWIPGSDSGHVHITNVAGEVNTFNYMSLGFTHTNTHSALFHCIPPIGNPYDIGGNVVPGEPTGLTFLAIDSTQTVNDPNLGITATLTPRH